MGQLQREGAWAERKEQAKNNDRIRWAAEKYF
jgi:hypothetical protein